MASVYEKFLQVVIYLTYSCIGRYLIILPSSIQLKLNTFLLQFGRTEVIDNTLNPDFVRKFIMDYFFEERENLRFDL